MNNADLLAFFADRLKVYLKDQGARHDLIDAVFSLGGQDDLLMIVRRVEALSKFLESDDGKNLLAGVKRASNILKIEEKKDNRSFDGLPNAQLLIQGEERDLHRAVSAAEANARKAVENEDFGAAMTAIAKLRGPVDAFFDKVTVNADDPSFRENRLKLLNRIRAATLAVADFSKIEGLKSLIRPVGTLSECASPRRARRSSGLSPLPPKVESGQRPEEGPDEILCICGSAMHRPTLPNQCRR